MGPRSATAQVAPGRLDATASSGGWPFVGRDAELDQLTELLADADRIGRPAIVVVEGEFGVGKSRLLNEIAARGRARGLAVRSERQLHRRSVRRELARLAASGGVLLIVDDVQLADQASLDLVGSVVRNRPAARIVVLVGCRTGRFPLALCSALDHASDAVRRMRLSPLSAADTDRLLGGESPARRRALHVASGGNPRYLKILTGATDDALAGLATSPVQLDERVGEALDRVITTELRTLGEAKRAVIHAAALLGDDVDLDQVAEVAQLTEVAAAGAVDGLVGVGLLCDGDGRMGFPHPLVRAAAYRLAGPGELVLAHQRAAVCLRRRGASLIRQAHHLEHAAQLGDAAASEVLAAAARIMLGRAPATSVRWLRVALRVLPQGPDLARSRSRQRVLLAKALVASGQLAAGQAELCDLRGLTGDARTAAVRLLASTARLLGDLPAASALASTELRRAGDLDPWPGLRFELLIAELLAGRWPHPDKTTVALDLATAHRHPGLLAAAATLSTLSAVASGQLTELIDRLRQATELVDGLDDGTLCDVLDVIVPLGWVELLVDHNADALRHVDRGLLLAQRYGQRHVTAQLHPISALARCRNGSITESLRAADRAVAAATAVGSSEMTTFAQLVRLRPLWLRDGAVAAANAAAELEAAPRLSSIWHQLVGDALAAEVLLALGRAAACQTRLQPWLADGSTTVRALAPGCCALRSEAHLAAGDLAGARRWIDHANERVADAPLAGQLGAVAHAEATVLLAENRADAAVARARAAGDQFASVGFVVRAAQTRMTLAEALLRDGQAAAARRELGSAREVLADAGAEWLAGRAQRAQRRLGARLPRQTRPAAQRCLTAREREIAELVAQGMTNRAIAATLYLSPRTVDAHLSRILTKLEVPTRAAIVRHLTDGTDG